MRLCPSIRVSLAGLWPLWLVCPSAHRTRDVFSRGEAGSVLILGLGRFASFDGRWDGGVAE